MNYTNCNGQWMINGFQFKDMALIFEKDDPFDTLLRHGPKEEILKIFLSDKYSKLAKMGCCLHMLEVPIEMVDDLNKCISISASKWCSKLEEKLNI